LGLLVGLPELLVLAQLLVVFLASNTADQGTGLVH
jgi:hypothetical protein